MNDNDGSIVIDSGDLWIALLILLIILCAVMIIRYWPRR